MKPSRVCVRALAFAGAVLWGAAAAGAADSEVVVLTSYPEEMTIRYEEAFERAHPGIDLRIVWQQGRDAMATLRSEGRGGIDVYWSPAAFNFPTLADEGVFLPLAVNRAEVPGFIGLQPISDPARRYEAFEVAGYGIAVNEKPLADRRIPLPARWDDLAKPAFADLVVMPVPSDVGFAPGLYDVILQDKGWSAGWAMLSEMAANATLAQRGGQMLGPVAEGKTAAALSIDFLPRNAIAEGQPLTLVYPARTAFLPAYVAIVASAPHPTAAKAFTDYVLSAAGQKLLFRREINRYPVRPDAYADADGRIVNPFSVPKNATYVYDLAMGPARGPMISALFNAAIASRQDKLRTLWRAIQAAEAKGATAATKEARALAGWMPVSDAEAVTAKVIMNFTPAKAGAAPTPQMKAWADALDESQARALALVSK